MNGMETYHGHVRTPTDAIILFEACRIGLLPRVQRRLSEKERQSIKSGSVFVWDEREAGMRRWTDGKSWSASRVSGSFLTYREMEGKRGGNNFEKNASREAGQQQGDQNDSDGGGPDGYRYKPDGLMKQSFSITTTQGQHLHLISYFSRSSNAAPNLLQPSSDPQLRHIRPEKGMYPESSVQEQSSIPAVTQGPMTSPGYRPPYGYVQPPGYPPSPMHTPPPHQYPSPYYHHQYAHYPGHSPLQNMHYPPPPSGYGAPQMTPYDRPPPPMANTGLPPPGYGPVPGYQGPHGYQGGYPYQPPPLQTNNYPPPHQSAPPPYGNPPAPAPAAQQPSQPASTQQDSSLKGEGRQDSHQSPKETESPTQESTATEQAPATTQAAAGAQAPATSGQTIPSISAMLNAGANGQPPPRSSSKSPTSGASRPLQDIPSHKIGFEANRDMQALRNLDKSTFKY
jgi:Gti1/Pac2 family transcription factor